MRVLVVVAVEKEARAIAADDRARVIVTGIGRTNAACATTESILRDGPFDVVLSVGIAGSLPPHQHAIGSILAASACVYAEEGLVTPEGFEDVASLGFPLGDFTGNTVPVAPRLEHALSSVMPTGRIATVATCSGTDAAALEVAERTGAVAEAMEGAAVVHAARRLGVAAIEIRAISNRTGDRAEQQWDLDAALGAIASAVTRAIEAIEAANNT